MSNEETPIVEETPVVAEVTAEVVEVVEPVAVIVEEPKPEPQPKKKHAVKSGVGIVVSGNDFDDVRLDMCVYKNPATRKSLSVHHLQRRLVELGYREAGTDKDGWYGDHTKLAVEAFQAANSLAVTGAVDAGMLEMLFADEPFINVVAV
jgi:peptidoglycan hydrolase-like protein with peptidoglycan-binding domain